MRLIVAGAGYVGLTTAAAFADQGHSVVVLENDPVRAAEIALGRAPFREPQLDALIASGLASGRLRVERDADAAVGAIGALPIGTAMERLIAMLAVGTPAGDDGRTDEGQLLGAGREIAAAASRAGVGALTFVIKSTAPVGADERLAAAAGDAARSHGASMPITIVVNPEFLRAGFAVHDVLHPDRVVIGGDDVAAVGAVAALYAGFVPEGKIMRMSASSATLVKYAANAMLATRISFMNELAGLATAVGADIEEVRRGIGADPRIGADYLHAGMGYGGSCLPKDLASLDAVAVDHGIELGVVRAVAAANERQSHLLSSVIARRLGGLEGAKIALWGLSFKGGSDDLRNSPGLVLARELADGGALVAAYDPSLDGSSLPGTSVDSTLERVRMCATADAALHDADALAIAADWPEFRAADLKLLARILRGRLVVDGRNIFDPAAARAAGLHYVGVGRGEAP